MNSLLDRFPRTVCRGRGPLRHPAGVRSRPASGLLTGGVRAGWPLAAGAAGMRVYVGTISGAETAQGNSVGPTGTFVQNETPVTSGETIPTVNDVPCTIAFNDTIIPYSGYNVSLISSNGNAYPGWPQAWQLNGGVSGTVNPLSIFCPRSESRQSRKDSALRERRTLSPA